jgi:hypothetical protein
MKSYYYCLLRRVSAGGDPHQPAIFVVETASLPSFLFGLFEPDVLDSATPMPSAGIEAPM